MITIILTVELMNVTTVSLEKTCDLTGDWDCPQEFDRCANPRHITQSGPEITFIVPCISKERTCSSGPMQGHMVKVIINLLHNYTELSTYFISLLAAKTDRLHDLVCNN
jgi:hypothetical protein